MFSRNTACFPHTVLFKRQFVWTEFYTASWFSDTSSFNAACFRTQLLLNDTLFYCLTYFFSETRYTQFVLLFSLCVSGEHHLNTLFFVGFPFISFLTFLKWSPRDPARGTWPALRLRLHFCILVQPLSIEWKPLLGKRQVTQARNSKVTPAQKKSKVTPAQNNEATPATNKNTMNNS